MTGVQTCALPILPFSVEGVFISTDLFDESVEADSFPQEQKRMHTKSRSRKSLALKQFFM